MPVALNEPLNVLQRLCEELEYSEHLDRAASIDDPYERMVEIAAFAVSAYASTVSRAGNKPFNPLLGKIMCKTFLIFIVYYCLLIFSVLYSS